MTVQRFQAFGWANPVEGGDGPFGGVYVKESDYDRLAARLEEAEGLLQNLLAVCREEPDTESHTLLGRIEAFLTTAE